MKADTKISLVFILLLPSFIIGMVIGILAWGFMAGFAFFREIDSWFEKSELLKKKRT